MKFRLFVAGIVVAGVVVAVDSAAYGVGKVSSGRHDPVSLGMLIGGVAVVACALSHPA